MTTMPLQKVLDGVTTTGAGQPILVEDEEVISVLIATSGNANCTIKAQGSIEDEKPDFGAAQTPANAWDYLELKDLEDGSAIDGDTGLVLAGTDVVTMYEVNVSGMRWFTLNVTARVAGVIHGKVKGFNHNV